MVSLSQAAVCSFWWVLSCSAFNCIALLAQFGLPIIEQVAKIRHRFAVHSCDLHPFCSCCMCCHALNKLDSSASRPLVAMASESNYYIVHSSHTLQSSLLLPSPGLQMDVFLANSKKEHRLQQLKKTYNRLQSLVQAHPTMHCIL